MTEHERYLRTYRFGPLERRGIAGGLRQGQVIVLAAACLLAVAVFRRLPTMTGLALAVLALALACGATFVPISGRQVDEWVPVLARWIWQRARGEDQYRSAAVDGGLRVDFGSGEVRRVAELPPVLRGSELVALDMPDGRSVGAFRDRTTGTYTAVLVLRVRSFGLLAAAEQERRLLRWGRVLASLARMGGAIRRVQVLERTLPHDEDQLARWLDAAGDPSVTAEAAARRSYEALLASAAAVTQDHEVLVAVQVDGSRTRSAQGPDGSRIRALVVREIRSLAERLHASDAGLVGLCSPSECARIVRLAYEPYLRRHFSALAPGHPEHGGLDPTVLGPTASDAAWDRYRCDGAVHRTYWVAQWPRLEVGPAFLSPLLLTQSAVRTFSVVLEPVAPVRSRSAVEAAITSDEADEDLRREKGFRTTARRRSQQEATRRREAELAEGHEELRFAGYITVTGRDDEELERHCDEVRQAAQQAYLDLQPMWGEQDGGFACGALPLCRGLTRAGLLS